MDDKELARIVARNLRRLIALSGKNQKDIAKELGYNSTTFNTWCMGKILPSMGKVQAMADYFGVGKTALYEENPDEIELTTLEKEIIEAYRMAEEGIKASVRKLLDVQEKAEGEQQPEQFSA